MPASGGKRDNHQKQAGHKRKRTKFHGFTPSFTVTNVAVDWVTVARRIPVNNQEKSRSTKLRLS
jgi:hypothetical protein